jgi:hypothetical protein
MMCSLRHPTAPSSTVLPSHGGQEGTCRRALRLRAYWSVIVARPAYLISSGYKKGLYGKHYSPYGQVCWA